MISDEALDEQTIQERDDWEDCVDSILQELGWRGEWGVTLMAHQDPDRMLSGPDDALEWVKNRPTTDRYRKLIEKLAAGKFESGDHAQELAREALQKEDR